MVGKKMLDLGLGVNRSRAGNAGIGLLLAALGLLQQCLGLVLTQAYRNALGSYQALRLGPGHKDCQAHQNGQGGNQQPALRVLGAR